MEHIKRQDLKNLFSNTKSFRIRIKWHAQEDDPFNGGYNYKDLHRMFSKYGNMELVVSSKKGSAMVEFENKSAAETALLEIGLIKNPLKLRGQWNRQQKRSSADIGRLSPADIQLKNERSKPFSFASALNTSAPVRYKISNAEDEVLSNLRIADERKRLIEELRYKISNAEAEVLSNLRRADERKRLIEELKVEDEKELKAEDET